MAALRPQKATGWGMSPHHICSSFSLWSNANFYLTSSRTCTLCKPWLLLFASKNFILWELLTAVCWNWCGWCEPCNPSTLLQCPRLSPSGLPISPPPCRGVLSEGQLLWTQTTVPFVLPGRGVHSAIFSCVSASPAGCQTCGPSSYANSSSSFSFFHSVCFSLWQCQCLSQWWRVLRRKCPCGHVTVRVSHSASHNLSRCYWMTKSSSCEVNENLKIPLVSLTIRNKHSCALFTRLIQEPEKFLISSLLNSFYGLLGEFILSLVKVRQEILFKNVYLYRFLSTKFSST